MPPKNSPKKAAEKKKPAAVPRMPTIKTQNLDQKSRSNAATSQAPLKTYSKNQNTAEQDDGDMAGEQEPQDLKPKPRSNAATTPVPQKTSANKRGAAEQDDEDFAADQGPPAKKRGGVSGNAKQRSVDTRSAAPKPPPDQTVDLTGEAPQVVKSARPRNDRPASKEVASSSKVVTQFIDLSEESDNEHSAPPPVMPVAIILKKMMRPTGYSFPRFENGDVYIEVKRTNQGSMGYRLHGSILAESSLWFDRELCGSIREPDNKMASEYTAKCGVGHWFDLFMATDYDIEGLMRTTLTKRENVIPKLLLQQENPSVPGKRTTSSAVVRSTAGGPKPSMEKKSVKISSETSEVPKSKPSEQQSTASASPSLSRAGKTQAASPPEVLTPKVSRRHNTPFPPSSRSSPREKAAPSTPPNLPARQAEKSPIKTRVPNVVHSEISPKDEEAMSPANALQLIRYTKGTVFEPEKTHNFEPEMMQDIKPVLQSASADKKIYTGIEKPRTPEQSPVQDDVSTMPTANILPPMDQKADIHARTESLLPEPQSVLTGLEPDSPPSYLAGTKWQYSQRNGQVEYLKPRRLSSENAPLPSGETNEFSQTQLPMAKGLLDAVPTEIIFCGQVLDLKNIQFGEKTKPSEGEFDAVHALMAMKNNEAHPQAVREPETEVNMQNDIVDPPMQVLANNENESLLPVTKEAENEINMEGDNKDPIYVFVSTAVNNNIDTPPSTPDKVSLGTDIEIDSVDTFTPPKDDSNAETHPPIIEETTPEALAADELDTLTPALTSRLEEPLPVVKQATSEATGDEMALIRDAPDRMDSVVEEAIESSTSNVDTMSVSSLATVDLFDKNAALAMEDCELQDSTPEVKNKTVHFEDNPVTALIEPADLKNADGAMDVDTADEVKTANSEADAPEAVDEPTQPENVGDAMNIDIVDEATMTIATVSKLATSHIKTEDKKPSTKPKRIPPRASFYTALEQSGSVRITNPEQDILDAYHNLFSIFYNKAPIINTESIDLALPQLELLVKLAELYGSMPVVLPHINNMLSHFIPSLPKAIFSDPPRWMKFAITIEHTWIYQTATLHMAGLYPIWPTTSILTDQDLLTFWVKRVEKAQILTSVLKSETNTKLFCNTIAGPPISATAKMTASIWRDWFSNALNNLAHSSDLKLDATLYRLLERGGDAYLHLSTVLSEFESREFGGQLDLLHVSKCLTTLKKQAQVTVAPLCVNHSWLDVEEIGIKYLTCIKPEDYELPWVTLDE